MTYPKLCRKCKHHVSNTNAFDSRCKHPIVNADDPWALSSEQPYGGTSCRSERERNWFAPCGKKGKLWEPQEQPHD